MSRKGGMNDFKEIYYRVEIGSKFYQVKVLAAKIEGKTQLNAQSLIKAQRALAQDLLLEQVNFDFDLFNFVLNISGKKAAEIAEYLGTTPSHISQLRHGKTESSKQFWKLFRATMWVLFAQDEKRPVAKILLSVA